MRIFVEVRNEPEGEFLAKVAQEEHRSVQQQAAHLLSKLLQAEMERREQESAPA